MISGLLHLMELNQTALHEEAAKVVPRELFLADNKDIVK